MARDNKPSTPFEDVDAADDFSGPLSRISTRESALASIFNEVQLFERYGQIERALEQLERVFEIVPGHPAAFEKKKKLLKKLGVPDIAIASMTRFPKDENGNSNPSMRELSAGDGRATQAVDASDFEVDIDASMSAEVDFEVDLDFDIDFEADGGAGPTEFGVKELDQVRGPKQPSLNAEMEEIRFLIDHDLLDDARETFASLYEKYPEHPGLLALSNLLPPSSAEILEAMDPESMLANLDEVFPGGLLGEDALKGAEHQALSAALTSELDADRFQAHYDLALAYRDMGMLEGAVSELGRAEAHPEIAVQSKTLLGVCLRELGRYESALEALEGAMNIPALSLEQRLDLWFEYAETYVRQGDSAKALSWFERVQNEKPLFRGVSKRIEELRE